MIDLEYGLPRNHANQAMTLCGIYFASLSEVHEVGEIWNVHGLTRSKRIVFNDTITDHQNQDFPCRSWRDSHTTF